MKKTLIALAVLAVSGAAFAQSTATISGSISVGVMDTGNAGGTAAVSTLGGGANAINIVTAEDLGGGLRGGFDSQMRFSAATGDMNSSGTGSALLHGANVYLSGGFGTVRMGKIIEASNCGFDVWGCTGGAGMMAGHAATAGHASTSISALVAAGTIANSVSYTTPTINGFSASYHTSMSVASRINERSVLNLSYAKGPLSAQYIQRKNSANTAANLVPSQAVPAVFSNTSTPISDANGETTGIAVGYDFGVAKLNVFNAKTDKATTSGPTYAASNVDQDITGFTASMPMGAYTLLAGYMKDKKAAATADTKIAAGVNYALSKRTTLGADVFKSEAVNAGTGFVIRARHTF